jgi:4-hydroxybenzoyl-CoA reductase subunit beta
MMRLPHFRYCAPDTIREAVEQLAGAPATAMLVAGGTDLLPNMKRRQQCPATLIGLRRIDELKQISNGDGLTIGAGVTLSQLIDVPGLRERHRGLWQAASQIATPDQNYEWRKAIHFCMKKDGDTCWVAPSSPKCLAVSSTDLAPMLRALGASVTLISATGQRSVDLRDLYRNDGIHYLARRPDELLASVRVPDDRWRSSYWKLRRRGAFDFPVLSVAAAARLDRDGSVAEARLVLGAVSSCPVEVRDAAAALAGQPLTDSAIARAADLAAQPARPMDNTDFTLHWRKKMVREFVTYSLREVRGDDLGELRKKISRLLL